MTKAERPSSPAGAAEEAAYHETSSCGPGQVKRLIRPGEAKRMDPVRLTPGWLGWLEEHYQVRLPPDYRQFLVEVGNGGVGPCAGLLWPLDHRQRGGYA